MKPVQISDIWLIKLASMNIKPMTQDRSRVGIDPRSGLILLDSTKRQTIDQRSTVLFTGIERHSFLSVQLPSSFPWKPTKQSQLKDPSVLTQFPFKHLPGSRHSSTSKQVTPSNLEETVKCITVVYIKNFGWWGDSKIMSHNCREGKPRSIRRRFFSRSVSMVV